MGSKNKKGVGTGLFAFFFILMIFSSLFFFLSFGMHYILYDYGISVLKDDVAPKIINVSGVSMQNIDTLATGYLSLTGFYDILFLVLLVSAFIESTLAAIKTRENGFLSFFGFVTIGNLFLIFVLSYATQIQGWILNDLIYNVILVSFETPVLTTFFNYSMFIAVFWYLWLIGINQVNIDSLKEKAANMFSRVKLPNNEGRFEE